jgi:hypothetical protein
MEWKGLLLQSGVMLIAVFVGMKFFGPMPPESTTPLRESVQASLHTLEGRLDKILDMLAQQQQPGSRPSDRAASSLNTEDIHRTLRTILATLSRLETKDTPVPPPHSSPDGSPLARAPVPLTPPPLPLPHSSSDGSPLARAPVPLTPPPVPPMAWMQGLSEETLTQVDEIFQEHALLLREKMAVASEGGRPPLDELQTIMEETNEEVKNKLKAILNEEEYRNFLDSLPQPPPFPKP